MALPLWNSKTAHTTRPCLHPNDGVPLGICGSGHSSNINSSSLPSRSLKRSIRQFRTPSPPHLLRLYCLDITSQGKNNLKTLYNLHMVRNGSETAWRTHHISVKALWLHQMSRRGIRFTYQSTSDMAADSLTKGLGASRLPKIKDDLCLIDD